MCEEHKILRHPFLQAVRIFLLFQKMNIGINISGYRVLADDHSQFDQALEDTIHQDGTRIMAIFVFHGHRMVHGISFLQFHLIFKNITIGGVIERDIELRRPGLLKNFFCLLIFF